MATADGYPVQQQRTATVTTTTATATCITHPTSASTPATRIGQSIVAGRELSTAPGLHVGDPFIVRTDGSEHPVSFDFFSTSSTSVTSTRTRRNRAGDVSRARTSRRAITRCASGHRRRRQAPHGRLADPRARPTSPVLGSTQRRHRRPWRGGSRSDSTTGSGGVFGKTGLDHALDIAGVGLAMLAVGAC